MTVTLKQSHAIRQAARLLYSFLPGSGYRAWQGHISFATVARDAGVGDFWIGGSKEPAIITLLERTLDRRSDRFEPLLLAIVRNGLTYRHKQGHPVERGEIESLNGLLLEVGFKFPELWASDFLDSLSDDPLERAQRTASAIQAMEGTRGADSKRTSALANLRSCFYALAAEKNRQAAGYALESLLNDLFRLFGLDPRRPFRVKGEQIDGSFVLDYETYLVEARWHAHPECESDLGGFREKIEGKSAFTRGVFISINGFSRESFDAIVRGKQPTFFLVDGYDLVTVMEGEIDLDVLLRMKLRKLTEEGVVFVSAKELLKCPGTN